MAKRHDLSHIKIKESERLLLHAILEKDDDLALSYYAKWTESVPFDEVEGGSFRLIPMLYKRFSGIDSDYPNKERIAGIYRYSLYRNHMLFRNCLKAVAEINRQGIHTIILKGAALTASYYLDYGIRPMSDVDILVEESEIHNVVEILINMGWRKEEETSIHNLIKAFHAVHMIHKDGYAMDVHWAINDYWFRTDPGKRHRFITESAVLATYDIEILSPTYQLLHNCIHGILYNEMSSVRWIADVITIIEDKGREIDWALLVEEAQTEEISYAMGKILKYLTEEFHAGVPKQVLIQLELAPKDKKEIQFFECVTKKPGFVNIKTKWLAYLHINRLELNNRTALTKCIMFTIYLKEIWKLESKASIPGYIIRRGFNKLVKAK